MELHTERQRRARNRPKQTTGVLVRTMHDARGIAEPLERYGELIACQIVGLYNAVHGLPATSRHTLARLKQLFHESEGLPATRKILLRPDYQWRYGYNHQTIYRRAPGTGRFLLGSGIYDKNALSWAKSTRIVQISADPRQAPSDSRCGPLARYGVAGNRDTPMSGASVHHPPRHHQERVRSGATRRQSPFNSASRDSRTPFKAGEAWIWPISI